MSEINVEEKIIGKNNKKEKNMEDPIENAKKVIAEAKSKKIMACLTEIQEVLSKYGCTLRTSPSTIVVDTE